MDVLRVGQGPALVVALHGIQGTRSSWLPVAQALDRQCTFVLPNLWGRGDAPRPTVPDDCSLDSYVQMVREVVDAEVGGRPYVLAGWSMGVSVALAYGARCMAGRGLHAPSGLALLSGSPQLSAVSWFRATDEPLLRQEIAGRERRLGLSEAAEHETVAWTWQSLRGTDQRSLLPGMPWPTLLVHGEQDEDCPASHARMLAAGLPDATLTLLAGAGHGILSQHTQQVAAALQAWLATLFAGVPVEPHAIQESP